MTEVAEAELTRRCPDSGPLGNRFEDVSVRTAALVGGHDDRGAFALVVEVRRLHRAVLEDLYDGVALGGMGAPPRGDQGSCQT